MVIVGPLISVEISCRVNKMLEVVVIGDGLSLSPNFGDLCVILLSIMVCDQVSVH